MKSFVTPQRTRMVLSASLVSAGAVFVALILSFLVGLPDGAGADSDVANRGGDDDAKPPDTTAKAPVRDTRGPGSADEAPVRAGVLGSPDDAGRAPPAEVPGPGSSGPPGVGPGPEKETGTEHGPEGRSDPEPEPQPVYEPATGDDGSVHADVPGAPAGPDVPVDVGDI